MPRQNQYQQKAQVHKHKIHTCPFSCLLNPSVDMNSATHSDVTVEAQSIQWLKWNSASAIPPTGLLYKSNNAAQVYSKSSRGRIFTLAPESWVCLSAQYFKERKKKKREILLAP